MKCIMNANMYSKNSFYCKLITGAALFLLTIITFIVSSNIHVFNDSAITTYGILFLPAMICSASIGFFGTVFIGLNKIILLLLTAALNVALLFLRIYDILTLLTSEFGKAEPFIFVSITYSLVIINIILLLIMAPRKNSK